MTPGCAWPATATVSVQVVPAIGVVMTGANQDGARGLHTIASSGGFTIVQDPKTAEVDSMPRAAIERTKVDKVLPLEKIGGVLVGLVGNV